MRRISLLKQAMIDSIKRKVNKQRKVRWHTPGETMSRVYKQGGIHWDAKKEWIMEAVRRGGTGGILCYDCSIYDEHGFGCYGCQDCNEAWRELPDGTIEYWTD